MKGAEWPNVPASQAWYGAPFDPYNVNYLPFSILLDREGKIIDTDVRGEALDRVLDKLL